MSEFNVVDHLLAKGFRTQARLAAATGRRQSSVAEWKAANRIPFDLVEVIIAAAHDEGFEIYGDDFIRPEFRRQGV